MDGINSGPCEESGCEGIHVTSKEVRETAIKMIGDLIMSLPNKAREKVKDNASLTLLEEDENAIHALALDAVVYSQVIINVAELLMSNIIDLTVRTTNGVYKTLKDKE